METTPHLEILKAMDYERVPKCPWDVIEREMYMLTFGQRIFDDPCGVHESIQCIQCCNLCIREAVKC
jgi:hypothetical protein